MKFKIAAVLATALIFVAVVFSACGLPEEPRKFTGLEITEMPSKTEYIEGETFDPAGMVVSAVYSDGTKEVIDGTQYNYDLKQPLKTTDTYVVILYMDKMTDVKINVRRDTAESVVLKTPATRVSYYEGEVFDPSGMVLTATLISGKTADVAYSADDERFSFDKTPLAAGAEYVEVSYDGIPVRQEIEVAKAPVPYEEFGAYLADCTAAEKTPVFSHEAVLSFASGAGVYSAGGVSYNEIKGTATDGEYIYAAASYGERTMQTRIFKLDPETFEPLGYSAEYVASSAVDTLVYVKDGYVYTLTGGGEAAPAFAKTAITSFATEGDGGAFEAASVPAFKTGEGEAVETSAIRDIDFNAANRRYAVLTASTVYVYSEDGSYVSEFTVPGNAKINSDDLWNSHISTTDGYVYVSYHNLYLNKHVYPVLNVYDWEGNAAAEITIEQSAIGSGDYTKLTDVLVVGAECYTFFDNPNGSVFETGISVTYTTEMQSG